MPKRQIRSFLASSFLLGAWRALPGTHLSLFTFHRFAVPDLGVAGHDPQQVADTLEQLRRERIPVLPLGAVVAALHDRTPLPKRAAVFTVDDGYFDFAEVGAPVFRQYDCPVTVFVVSGFLDGTCWLWWDRLRYILRHGRPEPLRSLLGSETDRKPSRDAGDDLAADFSRRCTRIPHSEMLRLSGYLSAQAGVTVPETPPAAFRPMSWDSVQNLSGQGVAFGPHSVSHPILTGVAADHASREIRDSWIRLREVLPDPLPVFSYPNGDYGVREIEAVRAAGLRGAVATTPQYLTVNGAGAADEMRYRIPRFPYTDQTQALLLTAAGFRLVQPSGSARVSLPTAAR
jgi:peptidoglycan/xylan/chitin deacetylase (PgdA/CDA1 family)